MLIVLETVVKGWQDKKMRHKTAKGAYEAPFVSKLISWVLGEFWVKISLSLRNWI